MRCPICNGQIIFDSDGKQCKECDWTEDWEWEADA
jgi:hypothetical protein